MFISKLIYLTGMLVRNNKISENYNFLIRSQHWNIEELRGYQYAKLKELLKHAYIHSEFYKNVFHKAGIDPNDIKSLADLRMITPVTKEDLIRNASAIQVKIASEKLFYSETSGSGGRPLIFYRNKDWDAWHNASVLRGYSWYNVKPWEKNGYLWGYNLAFKKRFKTRILDCLQNRFRLFSYKDSEIQSFIKKLRGAAYLGGYSSMIYEIAKRINRGKRDGPMVNLKMVKGTSEKIFDKYQYEAEAAFGKRIVSEYGAAEAGIIAFECPKGNMHINMETVIVEQEDKEIIVTNLVSRSFPIIRYKMGDYIELDETIRCECGMEHHVIKEVTGRVGKVIYGREDKYPSLTLYYVFKNLAMEYNIVLNYQVIQSDKGFLDMHIENHLKDNQRSLLLQELKKYFKDDMEIDIVDNVNLMSRDRKKQDFISKI